MKHFLVILCLSLLFTSCQKNKSIESIVERFEKKVSKNNSWQYDINYKMKYFSSDEDTLNYNSNCRLIRHESDTIFGGSFWIKNDSIDRYYDLENIYIINHNRRKITKFFPHKGQDWAVKGNTVSGVLDSYFLKANRLSRYLKDSTTTAILSDTVFRDSKRNMIEFRFKDDLPIEKQQKSFYFDDNDQLKSVTYSVKFQNEWQYNEWHFSNSKYNTITDNDLSSEFKKLTNSYIIEDFKSPDPKEMAPIANGNTAPEFNGIHFPSNDTLRLNDYKSKYVLIDFWYKDCFPCINAIASLNKLRTRYSSEKIVILGLNPFDDKPEDKEKLKEFIETNKMNYPTIFVDNEVTKAYNVRAYPTFYIINPNGEIVYSKIGHNETNEREIDSMLKNWID